MRNTYMLDERTLVLEGVTLGKMVELVVQMLVDLAAGAVLDEQAAENALAAHPHNLAVFRQLAWCCRRCFKSQEMSSGDGSAVSQGSHTSAYEHP
jgi:hypothetical protein